MIEPRELIEECKKHLRDTARFKHEYKKDIRKLITVLEKQLILYGVVRQSEQCCEPISEGFYLGTSCPKCKKPFRQNIK